MHGESLYHRTGSIGSSNRKGIPNEVCKGTVRTNAVRYTSKGSK